MPPLPIATTPVTLAAVPDTLPVTLPVTLPNTLPVSGPTNRFAKIVSTLMSPLELRLTNVLAKLSLEAPFNKSTAYLIVSLTTPPTDNTSGALAVPPKSPPNITLPLTVVDASCTAFETTVGSPKTFFTKAVVAMAVLLSVANWVTPKLPVGKLGVPEKTGDKMAAFKFKAVCVGVLTTLLISNVFSTLFMPKFNLAFTASEAPVPPLPIATTPVTLVAVPVTFPVSGPTNPVAVITPAAKLPFAALFTMALPVFKLVAIPIEATVGTLFIKEST